MIINRIGKSKEKLKQRKIKAKIIAANSALHANQELLKSKILSKRTKMNVYKSLIPTTLEQKL